jgi:uncharacterized protein (DUF2384 family)
MRVHLEINVPYSLREIFDCAVCRRARELRAAALDLYDGDSKKAAVYLCAPKKSLGGKSPLELSVESPKGHATAMAAIGQAMHGVYI